jgi:outer membrane lipoprotein-sorting protein
VNESGVRGIISTFNASDATGYETMMWLSTQNGFPFKTAIYDSNMQLVSSLTFANVAFQKLPRFTFVPSVGTKTITQMSLSEFYSEKGKSAIAREMAEN